METNRNGNEKNCVWGPERSVRYSRCNSCDKTVPDTVGVSVSTDAPFPMILCDVIASAYRVKQGSVSVMGRTELCFTLFIVTDAYHSRLA